MRIFNKRKPSFFSVLAASWMVFGCSVNDDQANASSIYLDRTDEKSAITGHKDSKNPSAVNLSTRKKNTIAALATIPALDGAVHDASLYEAMIEARKALEDAIHTASDEASVEAVNKAQLTADYLEAIKAYNESTSIEAALAKAKAIVKADINQINPTEQLDFIDITTAITNPEPFFLKTDQAVLMPKQVLLTPEPVPVNHESVMINQEPERVTLARKALLNAKGTAKHIIDQAQSIDEVETIEARQIPWVQKYADAADNVIRSVNALVPAKKAAIAAIIAIDANVKLNKGALTPEKEARILKKAKFTKIRAIKMAGTVEEINSLTALVKTEVNAERHAYEAAIRMANLNQIKQQMIATIQAIDATVLLDEGATLPAETATAFKKAKDDAVVKIDQTTSIQALGTCLNQEEQKVEAAKSSYEAAITLANAQHLEAVKDLAIDEVQTLFATVAVDTGAATPDDEATAFEKAKEAAKTHIESATSFKNFVTTQSEERKNVAEAKAAYEAAIRLANTRHLDTIRAEAIAAIQATLLSVTLDEGATEPTTKADAFEQAKIEARANIESAENLKMFETTQAEERKHVAEAKAAYEAAITLANAEHFDTIKADAIAKIQATPLSVTLDAGATEPATAAAAFEQAKMDAKANLEAATSLNMVETTQAEENNKVAEAKAAYEAAIELANGKHLATIKAHAIAEIQATPLSVILDEGATEPSTEAAAFKQAKVEAKASIEAAVSFKTLETIQVEENNKVAEAKAVYEAAIKLANVEHLTTIKANAIAGIQASRLSVTLDEGATEPATEAAAFEQAKQDAKANIEAAASLKIVATTQTEESQKVAAAKAAYEAAITLANAEYLDTMKANAIAGIQATPLSVTLDAGATEPATEAAAFEQAKLDARANIQAATSLKMVETTQVEESIKVAETKAAYEAAITLANAEHLNSIKTDAIADIQATPLSVILDEGATEPSKEAAAFEQAKIEAKANIEAAASVKPLETIQVEENKKVAEAKIAYEAALQSANALYLSKIKQEAIHTIDAIGIDENLTLDEGATEPSTEAAAFEQAKLDAKASIEAATSLNTIETAQAEESKKVAEAKTAYEAAIKLANARHLDTIKADAIAGIQAKPLSVTLAEGATEPATEAAAFEQVKINAKASIEAATSLTTVERIQTDENKKVAEAKAVYEAAIKLANARHLDTIKADAIARIEANQLSVTLDEGATAPSTEAAAFEQAKNDARANIEAVASLNIFETTQAEENKKLAEVKAAYQQAIKVANTEYLDIIKANAIANILANQLSVTLDAGATEPSTEADAFEQAKLDAKANIEAAASPKMLEMTQAEENEKVAEAKRAYEAAITSANAQYFDTLQADAVAAIQANQLSVTLGEGATVPSTEAAAFEQAKQQAKASIKAATSFKTLEMVQAEENKKVEEARIACEAAIKSANAVHLSMIKQEAIKTLDAMGIDENSKLDEGATKPSKEVDAFEQAKIDAKASIEAATSLNTVEAIQAEEKTKVAEAKSACEAAIKLANAQHLDTIKANAIAEIEANQLSVTRDEDVAEPPTEAAAFEQAKMDAKANIEAAASLQIVETIRVEESKKVAAAKIAGEAALKRAIADFLDTEKAKAIAAIQAIDTEVTLEAGASMPTDEETALARAKADAIISIDQANSIKAFKACNTEQEQIVKAARDEYEAAINLANADYLAIIKQVAINAIQSIVVAGTLDAGTSAPAHEATAFGQAKANAVMQINQANSIKAFEECAVQQERLVRLARNTYDVAIRQANLNQLKQKAVKTIQGIDVTITLDSGAKAQREDAIALKKAKADAVIHIHQAKSIKDVDALLEKQVPIITALQKRYEEAIASANARHLESVKAKAIAEIQAQPLSTALDEGATEPLTAARAFEQAKTTAKANIEKAKSLDEIKSVQIEDNEKVTEAKLAYEAAITSANLNKIKSDAITALSALPALERSKYDHRLYPAITEARKKLEATMTNAHDAEAVYKVANGPLVTQYEAAIKSYVTSEYYYLITSTDQLENVLAGHEDEGLAITVTLPDSDNTFDFTANPKLQKDVDVSHFTFKAMNVENLTISNKDGSLQNAIFDTVKGLQSLIDHQTASVSALTHATFINITEPIDLSRQLTDSITFNDMNMSCVTAKKGFNAFSYATFSHVNDLQAFIDNYATDTLSLRCARFIGINQPVNLENRWIDYVTFKDMDMSYIRCLVDGANWFDHATFEHVTQLQKLIDDYATHQKSLRYATFINIKQPIELYNRWIDGTRFKDMDMQLVTLIKGGNRWFENATFDHVANLQKLIDDYATHQKSLRYATFINIKQPIEFYNRWIDGTRFKDMDMQLLTLLQGGNGWFESTTFDHVTNLQKLIDDYATHQKSLRYATFVNIKQPIDLYDRWVDGTTFKAMDMDYVACLYDGNKWFSSATFDHVTHLQRFIDTYVLENNGLSNATFIGMNREDIDFGNRYVANATFLNIK